MSIDLQQIKCICFDIGGVLSYSGKGLEVAKERWGKNFTWGDFRRMMHPKGNKWRMYQNGEITTEEYLACATKAGKRENNATERNHFALCLDALGGELYTPMIEIAIQLAATYTIAILSNNNELMFNKFMETIADRKKIFSCIISSHHVGVSKPDPKIYRILLERLELKDFSKVFFIDDKIKNVEAARQLGMHSYLFPAREKGIEQAYYSFMEYLGMENLL